MSKQEQGTPGPTLSVVIPFHNETANLEELLARLLPALEQTGETFELVCVNDGSTDGTLDALLSARARMPHMTVVDLSRNFGKEAALTAGIDHARGRAVIPMDSDLQDPPELISQMVARWREGYPVVLAQRTNRDTDALLKRLSAGWFYRVHNALSEIRVPENVGDFRLMDRQVVDAIQRLPERQRFLKGIFAWVGFRTTIVPFRRPPRHGGSTTWNYWRLWNFALDGITSFSTAPLRLWTYVGVSVSSLSFLFAAFIFVRTIVMGVDLPGYASLMVAILFLGGLQLISLGVLGEYLGRVLTEVKHRPSYVVSRIYGDFPPTEPRGG